MAKYRLMAEHVLPDGRILPVGTEVGTDTPIPWDGEPSNQMMGLDGEGKEKVNALHQRLYGRDATADLNEPDHVREQREMAEAEEEETVSGEPVSEQQRREYEAIKKEELPPPPAPVAPTVAPTRGGQRTPSAGPATPKVDEETTRPTRPNEEQYPKG